MAKKFWIGFVVVFLIIAIWEAVVNMVLLSAAYQQTSNLWRPEGEMKIWLFYVCYLFVAFFMTLVFSKWYRGKGVMEGLQFGVYLGLMISVPMAYGMYGSMPIPYSMSVQWFVYGLIKHILGGVALSLIYGKTAQA